MNWAYYNEIDKFNAEWLRQLMKLDMIAPGVVDDRSIVEVQPEDLQGFTQHHFFAGVGVWSYALRKAGWPDDMPVYSGSAPCQPFSNAGKREGVSDERHLWPEFFRLIQACQPSVVFGEQVASNEVTGKLKEAVSGGLQPTLFDVAETVGTEDQDAWLDIVSADLENEGYAVGSIIAPACGFGAPHERSRLYWVADISSTGLSARKQTRELQDSTKDGFRVESESKRPSDVCCVGHSTVKSQWPYNRKSEKSDRKQGANRRSSIHSELGNTFSSKWRKEDFVKADFGRAARGRESGLIDSLANTKSTRQRSNKLGRDCEQTEFLERPGAWGYSVNNGKTGGFWSDAEWLYCIDEKHRSTKPGVMPLVDGASSRMGHSGDISLSSVENTTEARRQRIKGYGNAIVAPQAIEFIKAFIAIKNGNPA